MEALVDEVVVHADVVDLNEDRVSSSNDVLRQVPLLFDPNVI